MMKKLLFCLAFVLLAAGCRNTGEVSECSGPGNVDGLCINGKFIPLYKNYLDLQRDTAKRMEENDARQKKEKAEWCGDNKDDKYAREMCPDVPIIKPTTTPDIIHQNLIIMKKEYKLVKETYDLWIYECIIDDCFINRR